MINQNNYNNARKSVIVTQNFNPMNNTVSRQSVYGVNLNNSLAPYSNTPNQNNAPQVQAVYVPVINNQPPTTIIATDINMYRTTSIMARCTSCNQTGPSNVHLSFNISNYLCYCLCTPIVWLVYQTLRNKDYSCSDGIHYCSSCGGLLANYTAC